MLAASAIPFGSSLGLPRCRPENVANACPVQQLTGVWGDPVWLAESLAKQPDRALVQGRGQIRVTRQLGGVGELDEELRAYP
jgi:hypothetical protein